MGQPTNSQAQPNQGRSCTHEVTQACPTSIPRPVTGGKLPLWTPKSSTLGWWGVRDATHPDVRVEGPSLIRHPHVLDQVLAHRGPVSAHDLHSLARLDVTGVPAGRGDMEV